MEENGTAEDEPSYRKEEYKHIHNTFVTQGIHGVLRYRHSFHSPLTKQNHKHTITNVYSTQTHTHRYKQTHKNIIASLAYDNAWHWNTETLHLYCIAHYFL